MLQIGCVLLENPITSPYYQTGEFINRFVKQQILGCGAELNANYFQVETNVSVGDRSTCSMVFLKGEGLFCFDTEHALQWFKMCQPTPTAFLLDLLIQCLSTVRVNYTLSWRVNWHEFLTPENARPFLLGRDRVNLERGIAIIIEKWRGASGQKASGIALLRQLDLWIFETLIHALLNQDGNLAGEHRHLVHLIQDPIQTVQTLDILPSSNPSRLMTFPVRRVFSR